MFRWIYRNRVAMLTTLGTLVVISVGTFTGVASWNHIVHVGKSVGEPSAAWLPLAIDGMMLAGTVLAAVDRFRGFTTRGWAIAGLWLGTALTLAFNVISAWERGFRGMLIAVLFAVAFIVSVEMVFHPSRTPLEAVKKRMQKVVEPSAAPTASVVVEPVKAEAVTPQVPVKDPKPSQPPTGPRGRKHGPQVPPPGRRAPKHTNLGGPNNNGSKKPAEKPMAVTVVTNEEKPAPVAMEEKLSDLIDSAPGPKPEGVVVS